jgi:formylglycine-generating enzyme required for sulfatase activity
VRLGSGFRSLGLGTYTCAGLTQRVGGFEHLATGIVLHLLPGGTFTPGQEGGRDSEAPGLPTRLAPFLAGRLPVRQEEWDRVGGSDERRHRDPDLPIHGVSWHAAQAWLASAGGGLRLPTQDEWEWACRAGAATPYPWGEVMDPTRCWYLDNTDRRPQPCAAHAALGNAFGLVDTCGQVAEWCQGELDAPMEGSAWQEWAPGRAHRGGSFEQPASRARAGWRAATDPSKAYPDLGLRAFRSLAL